MICCCTDAPSVQSDARTPHPLSSAGSKLLVNGNCPCDRSAKLWFEIAPHESTLPVVAGLCGPRVRQVAVRHEVAVRIGPGARDAQRGKRPAAAGRAQRRVRVGPVVRHARPFQVLADVRLDGRLAVAEDVPRHAHARRDVLVRVDAFGARDMDRRRQERRRPFRLFGIPARRTIEPQRALQGQAVVRPLILREERVPAAVAVVLPRSDELGDLVRDEVVDAERQILAVRAPRPVVRHQRALVADLEAVRAGDVRHRTPSSSTTRPTLVP